MLIEGRTLSGLHAIPEIVRVLDCFQANGTAFLVMEFIRGMSLRSYIERLDEPLSFAEARDMLLPVIRALEQVHKKRLIHRDITPDNLLVRETGKLKIIDFGSAREFEDYVKSHALSEKKTEEGVLYQLSSEDALSWGQPCNRLRFEWTVEDFLKKLGEEGYTASETKETAAECSVEIYRYGAILTSFVNIGKYEIAPDVSLEIEYDLVNREITEITLRAEENAGDALTQADSTIRHILSPYKAQMVYQRMEVKNTIRFVPYNTINWLGYGDRYYWP